jgi:acyl-CoA thioesterase-1
MMMRRLVGCSIVGLVTFLIAGCGGPRLSPLDESSVVVAFGDSLTSGVGAKGLQGYPPVLGEMLGCEVINAGVPGEVTAEGVRRLPGVLEDMGPDLVILCHGGNDMLGRKDDAETKSNLGSMIIACQAAGADVLLVAVPRPSLLLKPPRFYRELAKQYGIPLEEEVLHDVLSRPALKGDHVHPNDAGYALMAEAIAALIRDS